MKISDKYDVTFFTNNDVKITSNKRIISWKINVINFKNKIIEYRLNKNKPAIYIFVDQANKRLYVGEGDRWFSRIENRINQDWISSVIVIMSNSTDNELSKDELKFYENLLINNFNNNKSLQVDNIITTYKKTFDYTKETTMRDEYQVIEKQINFLIPVDKVISNSTSRSLNKDEIECYTTVNKEHINATYNFKTKQTIISEGQTYYLKKSDSDSERQIKKWNDVYKDTLLKAKAGQLKIVNSNPPYKINILKDIVFDSSSAAASFLKGRGCDGLADWKREKDNKKLNEIMSRFSNDDTPKDKKN